jgi:hypothetical protein
MIKIRFPNSAILYRQTGNYDATGEKVLSAGIRTSCAFIRFRNEVKATNVVASSTGMSGSRGGAWENVGTMVLLMPVTAPCSINDKLHIVNQDTRVISVFPRFDVDGVLNHYEIEVTPWE